MRCKMAIVITLLLLNPNPSVPSLRWEFEDESTIRIGRASDNDVVIGGSVVSRYHLELWNSNPQWEVINLGANGTYVNGKSISQMPVFDGMVLRLGSSGPQICIRLNKIAPQGTIKSLPGIAEDNAATNRSTFLTRPPGATTAIETANQEETEIDLN